MKTLVIVRHAKSSWDFPELSDDERPLNKRGHKSAPEMAARLKKRGFTPEVIYSSKANRALTTATYFAEKLNYPKEQILISGSLLHRSSETMLSLLRDIPDSVENAMIFGHNPGFTHFVNDLTDSDIFNIPTAGVAMVEIDVRSWKDVAFAVGRLAWYSYPKKND